MKNSWYLLYSIWFVGIVLNQQLNKNVFYITA